MSDTRRYTIEIRDAGQVVTFKIANWTVEERRLAVAQIERLLELPETPPKN